MIHVLIFILATIIGLGGKYNSAPPESGKTLEVWFSAIAIFNVIVIGAAIVQLRIRMVWVFLITVIALIVVLIYLLQQIVFYIESLFYNGRFQNCVRI